MRTVRARSPFGVPMPLSLAAREIWRAEPSASTSRHSSAMASPIRSPAPIRVSANGWFLGGVGGDRSGADGLAEDLAEGMRLSLIVFRARADPARRRPAKACEGAPAATR